jgi:hypothetical protein
MTFAEMSQKLQMRIAEVQSGKAIRLAAHDTSAEYGKRIFDRGENSAGDEIGEYSKEEMWASPKNSPRRPNGKGKTGKSIKGGYYKQGYYEFKGDMGRDNSKVNLVLFGDLKSDVFNGREVAEPIEVNAITYELRVKRQENLDKINGLEDKYGTVFDLTTAEVNNFIETAEFETIKILSQL